LRDNEDGAKESISTRDIDVIQYVKAEIVVSIYARKDVTRN
jgi:hypothetical protein